MIEAVVVGAGIQGLATCHALLRRGVRNIALLEQFQLGHHRGSSHGRSRITRSSYSTLKYVEMMQWVHEQGWPAWETEHGGPLLHPLPGVFFGPEVDKYRRSLEDCGALQGRFELLDPDQGRRRFPRFLFPDSPAVIVDHTCAVVAAQRTREFLIGAIQAAGVDVHENCSLLEWTECADGLELHTSQTRLRCRRLILTTGPWSRRWTGLEAPLRVAHQDVGYFQLSPAVPGGAAPPPGTPAFSVPGGAALPPGTPASFPVWVYAGPESFYGLPEFERPGVKLAHHRTGAENDDPDRPIGDRLPESARAVLEEFARAQWAGRAECVGYEACLYTNTVSQDFILDCWPGQPRVVLGAGFSGHGFKFAPLVGEVLAGLALHGDSDIADFTRHREAFRLKAAGAWDG